MSRRSRTRAARRRPGAPAGGFSLIEVMVALPLVVLLAGGLFALSLPAGALHRSLPEMAAVQQRLRHGFDRLQQDLAAAGRGTTLVSPGPLMRILPPVVPYRLGRRASPAPHRGSSPGVITLLRIPSTGGAETTTLDPLPGDGAAVRLAPGPACRPPSCGYRRGTLVLVFDEQGHWDAFRVGAVGPMTLTLDRLHQTATTFDAGAVVAPLVIDHYYLDAERAELRHYDGWRGDFPVVDDVVAFDIRLLGVARAAGDPCRSPQEPGDRPLVELDAALWTDGPWCGPPELPFDADLRRVRAVEIDIRVQAADGALRGADPARFARPGWAPAGAVQVPDLGGRFTVAPRNLAP